MATKGVEENQTGTIPEAEEQAKAAAAAEAASTEKGKTPEPVSTVSPSQAPKVYTEAAAEALVHAATSEAGREKKAMETELTNLKEQIQGKDDELTDVNEEIEKLGSKLDDLSSDDPQKVDLVKELKVAQEERRRLKADRRVLDGEKAELTESRSEIAVWKRDQLVYQVADEFVTADGKAIDFDSFKSVADKFNLSGREGLVTLAETMGLKPKAKESETPSLTPFSGRTSGGGSGVPTDRDALAQYVQSLSTEEYAKVAPEINKMMREGKVK